MERHLMLMDWKTILLRWQYLPKTDLQVQHILYQNLSGDFYRNRKANQKFI